ncbi:hypothetical protein B0H13DRAFT_1856090 [Mycena leptocephala]|nr:hypothetical protein B0H13DRAFT_1856090 [Mycena leptocephala]
MSKCQNQPRPSRLPYTIPLSCSPVLRSTAHERDVLAILIPSALLVAEAQRKQENGSRWTHSGTRLSLFLAKHPCCRSASVFVAVGASSSSKMLQSSRHTYTTVTQGRSRASHGRNVDRWRRFLTRSRASSPRAQYLSRRPTCQIRTTRAATHCATSRSLMPPLFSESLHLVHNFEPVTAAHCIGLSRMPCHLPAEPIIPLCRRSTVAGIVGLVETARIRLLRNNVVVV